MFSRSNSSIISVLSMSEANSDNTTSSDYMAAFENIFGPSISSGVYVDVLSSNAIFVGMVCVAFDSAAMTLIEDGVRYLRALITFPLLYFQQTWGSPTAPQYSDTSVVEGLSPSLYVSMSLSETQMHVVIPRWTVWLYTATLLAVYLWCLGCLVLSLFIRGPLTTPHEVLDFASMISGCRHVDESALQVLGKVGSGSSKAYRRELADKTLFVGRLVGEKLVFLGSEERQEQKSGEIIGIRMNGS